MGPRFSLHLGGCKSHRTYLTPQPQASPSHTCAHARRRTHPLLPPSNEHELIIALKILILYPSRCLVATRDPPQSRPFRCLKPTQIRRALLLHRFFHRKSATLQRTTFWEEWPCIPSRPHSGPFINFSWLSITHAQLPLAPRPCVTWPRPTSRPHPLSTFLPLSGFAGALPTPTAPPLPPLSSFISS